MSSYTTTHYINPYEDNDSSQLEYPGYDASWVLGAQQQPAEPLVRRPSGSSYYGSSYRTRPTSNYSTGSSFWSRPSSYDHRPPVDRYGQGAGVISSGAYPHRLHYSEPRTHWFQPSRHQTSRSHYSDVKLRVDFSRSGESRSKLTEALRKIKGVDDVRLEGWPHTMVTVYGTADPKKILKKARKVVKNTDYWSDLDYSGYSGSAIHNPRPGRWEVQ